MPTSTTKPHKPIIFGIMLQGAGSHINVWHYPRGPADAGDNFDFLRSTALKAEAARIAFAFVADELYINDKSIPHFLICFKPLSRLSALTAATTKIGLIGIVSTSYSDPFIIVRQFALLDLLSGGRSEWSAVTSLLDWFYDQPYKGAQSYLLPSGTGCRDAENNFVAFSEHVADEVLHWVGAGAADSFILGFPVVAKGAEDFICYVLPIPQEQGAFRRDLPNQMLRDRLQLPFRQSRHVARPAEAAPRQAAAE